jgi:FkbH-like protein
MPKLTLSVDQFKQLDDCALGRLVSVAARTDLLQFWAPALSHLTHAGERFVAAFSHRSEQLSAVEDLQSTGWLEPESSWMACNSGRWIRAKLLYKMDRPEAALSAYTQALRQHSDSGEMAYEAAQLADQLQQPAILRDCLHSLSPELMDYHLLNRWATFCARCNQQHPEWFKGPILRVAVLLDTSTQFLLPIVRLVAFVYGLRVELFSASGSAVAAEIFDPSSKLYVFKPDVVFLGDSPRNLDASSHESSQFWVDQQLRVIEERWIALQQSGLGSIVQQNYIAPPQAAWAQSDGADSRTLGYRVAALNQAICERASQVGIHVLDLAQVQLRLQPTRAWDDARLWYSVQQCPSLEAVPELAAAYVGHLRAMAGLGKKVLVLDLDNTLWGGALSELGLEGIDVGGHSPQGEAYADFQRYVLELKQHGVLLAVCSKNDEQLAKSAFLRQDLGELRLEDFVEFVANWEPKWRNVETIARNLNLGLDSFVFVDDNPVECLEMEAHLPQVTVVQLPNRVEDYIACLDRGRWFQSLGLSAEDALRTERYRANQQRNYTQRQASSLSDFLSGLGMRASSGAIDRMRLKRVEQLLRRCNQFNLNGRTWSHGQLHALFENSTYWTRWFQLSDRFGDYGLCGSVVIKKTTSIWELEAFVMSCRAMGRGLELLMLNAVMRAAYSAGAQYLRVGYKATTKNEPMRLFLQQYFQNISEVWDGQQQVMITAKIDALPKTAILEAPIIENNPSDP